MKAINAGSQLAKYGRSKEKRSDAKLVVLAMVINIEGFIKYSAIHEGNYADTADIKTLIEKISSNTSTAAKPIVVMDAGIATEKNLATLTQQGYKYVVVSRAKIKDYQPVQQGIKNRLEQGFEEQLNLIKQSLSKPRGIKKADKVQQRIGRAKQKYPSIHHLYNITLDIDTATKIVKNIYWQKDAVKAREANKKLGVYFLRTNLEDTDEALEWMIYNTIREIESTFRILKTDLDLRPIYHKNDTSTMAHLHLGLLAYWLVNTIRYQLKQSGINDDWKEIKRKASTQKSVLTTAQNSYDKMIQIKRCTEPTEDLRQIHNALKQQKSKPFKQIKFVVHKPPPNKIEIPAIAELGYG